MSQLGNLERGEIYCRAAVRLYPDRPEGHRNLGLVLRSQERYVEVAQAFISVAARRPKTGRPSLF